jgi:predicted permease
VRLFYTRLIDEAHRIPGISASGATTDLPLNVRERRAFTIENEPEAAKSLPHSVAAEWILGSYFEAMGIPLKRGRFISAQDREGAEAVAVINETLARKYWGSADPVGQRIAWGGPTEHGPWMRIVGVVGDVKQGPLNTETVPHTYIAWQQVPDQVLGENIVGMMRSMRLAMRSEIDPASMISAARKTIRALDPALPITAVQTMEEVVQASTAAQRFNTLLIGSFGLLALLLSTIGIAGVLATSVSGRTRELGVRLALGAQPQSLVRMVVREGMMLAAFGLLVGLPAAWVLSRGMSTLLFEVSPRDPVTFGAVAAVLAIGSLLACWIPAWRAARISPLAALRTE